jgi:hypothetical protein
MTSPKNALLIFLVDQRWLRLRLRPLMPFLNCARVSQRTLTLAVRLRTDAL